MMTKPEDKKRKMRFQRRGKREQEVKTVRAERGRQSGIVRTHAGTRSLHGQRLASASESMKACVSPQAPA